MAALSCPAIIKESSASICSASYRGFRKLQKDQDRLFYSATILTKKPTDAGSGVLVAEKGKAIGS